MRQTYKQYMAKTIDSPDANEVAASEAAAASVKRKALTIYLITAFALNSMVMLFVRLAQKATGWSEWLIFPLAIASALSIFLFLSKWFFSKKKA